MSDERKQMMKLFGAEIIEVGCNAFQEAIQLRDKMLTENTNFWSPNQFENFYNIECHEMTTAKEIIRQLFVEENVHKMLYENP